MLAALFTLSAQQDNPELPEGWVNVTLNTPSPTPIPNEEIELKDRNTFSGSLKVYIKSCQFGLINSDSNGGCISYTSTTTSSEMLIELCIFNSCTSNAAYGGCIFMGSATIMGSGQGSFVLNKCCANECYSTRSGYSYGQFVFTNLNYDVTHLNNIIDSSIINSKADKGTSFGTLYLQYAKITINTVNLSGNKCSQFCPIVSYPYSTSSTTSSVEYCSIRENEATYSYGLCLSNAAKYSVTNCNLIQNTISSNGLIWTNGKVTMRECTILENSANPMFYCYYSSNSITLENCTIESDKLTKGGNGQLITTNWSPKPKSFINAIKCTEDNEKMCVAEFDVVGSLSPDLPEPKQTPFQTPDKTPDETPTVDYNFFARYTWYCEDDLTDHSRISTWYALEYLLLISCMPTDPAKDIWYDVQ